MFETLKKVVCPVCLKERNALGGTPLFYLEERLDKTGSTPWWGSKGWSLKQARKGNLQWACKYCLKEGRAIEADPTLQTFCDHPPYFAYFDVKLYCEDCKSQFIFSASEQRFWYEELKFWVQSRPKQCGRCRRIRRKQSELMRELGEAFKGLDAKDGKQLAHIAELYSRFGDKEKSLLYLRRAKNQAKDSEERKRLIEQIEKLLTSVEE